MDSLTQAALGAAVGHLCWNKKIGRKALALGALGGTIPDLDVLLYPLLDDVQRLYWHRGESHSVWFVFVGALGTGWLLSRYFKERGLPYSTAALGALLIYATHILIDYFTIYGTQLLAPLSRSAFALGNFFIIDPLFTLPLLVGCLIAAFSRSTIGRRANIIGLTLSACYTLWSFGAQAAADHTFRTALSREGTNIIRQRTTAAPFTTFLWRHLAQTDDGFLLAYLSVFDPPGKNIQFYHIPRRPELVEEISESRTFAVIEWFSQGWWYAFEDGDNQVRVVDLRFNEIPSFRDQSYRDWDWPFVWRFDRIKPEEKSLYSVLPDVNTPLQTLGLLAERIRGGRNWYPVSAGLAVNEAASPDDSNSL